MVSWLGGYLAFHRWCLNNFELYIRRDGFDVKREWRARYQMYIVYKFQKIKQIQQDAHVIQKGKKGSYRYTLYSHRQTAPGK